MYNMLIYNICKILYVYTCETMLVGCFAPFSLNVALLHRWEGFGGLFTPNYNDVSICRPVTGVAVETNSIQNTTFKKAMILISNTQKNRKNLCFQYINPVFSIIAHHINGFSRVRVQFT